VLGTAVFTLLLTTQQTNKLTNKLPLITLALLYLLTLAPAPLPADNGEFQLIGATLGLAHPPGFALYTILAHLSTWLPLPLSAGEKINLLSVGIALAILALLIPTSRQLNKQPNSLPTLILLFALGSSTTFWAQAVMANIRLPTLFFATLAFYALFRFDTATRQQNRPTADRWLTVWALAVGLGLTHHLSLAFMSLIMGLFVLGVDRSLIRTPRRWLKPGLALLIGLLPLLYLPWAEPALRAPQAWLNYALALGFQGDFFYFATPAALWQRAGVLLNIYLFQFPPLVLLGAVVGAGLLLRQAPARGLLLLGCFLLHSFIVATYRAPQAVEYLLPAYLPLVLWLGYGVSEGVRQSTKTVAEPWVQVGVGLLLTAVFLQTLHHFPSYWALGQSEDTAVYTDTLLSQAPANSLILANWHWATPLWYEQQINGRRPDVEIVYLYPQTADYPAEWVSRIQQGLAEGRPVISTFYEENSYQALPPAYPLGEAFLFLPTPLADLPAGFTLWSRGWGNGLILRGYQLSTLNVAVGQEAVVTLAWSWGDGAAPRPVSFYAHLLNSAGQVVAQDDVTVRSQAAGINLTQFRLTPRYEARPGTHTLVLGWAENPEATRTPLALLTVTPMAWAAQTAHPRYQASLGAERAGQLVGYDWDNTLAGQPRLYLHWQQGNFMRPAYWTEVVDVPTGFYELSLAGVWGVRHTAVFLNQNPGDSFYVPLGQGLVWWGSRPWLNTLPPLVPGQELTLRQRFTANQPLQRDLGFSVRLLGFAPDGYTWAWRTPDSADNDIPALGAIPTLKWIAASNVTHPRTLTIDPTATAGQSVGGLVRPYDVFTNRPVPLLDGRLATSPQPWLPLGLGTIAE
jgi:hypothetical protein